MTEQVQQRVEPQLLRYRMDTRPRLSAEEAELYLMAAIDEVSLGCLLVDLGRVVYEDPLRNAPHTPEDFARYRQFVTVESIDYRNPWELVLGIAGAAGAVAAAIQAMYLLRSSRRRTEAETEKLRAEAEKLRAETRKLDAAPPHEDVQRSLEAHEKLLKQLELASDLIARERRDRATREFLAEIILTDPHGFRVADLDYGLAGLRGLLADSMMDSMERATGPTAAEELETKQRLLRSVADNIRLLASIRRLDGVERTVEVLGDDPQS